MASLIALCNRALAEIAKGQIASLEEASIESRECVRFAQPLLDEMADWSDEIPLGRVRVALAEVANDRPAEWLHVYAEPSDIAAAIAIRAVEDDATALPTSGPYNFPMQEARPLAFIHEGGMIYTNVPNATLIYQRSSVAASDLSPLMQRAFVLELATRIAAPVAKWDASKIDAKAKQAEVARQRAVADEENKTRRTRTRYVSEAEYARMGIGV